MNIVTTATRWLDAIPYALIALFLRIVAAHPFFVSGQTKIDGPTVGGEVFGLDVSFQIPTSIRDSTFALFADEYRLPLISPTLAAYTASGVEFILPLLLVIGLLTRLSAFGLLMMTMVIQIFVFPDAWWTVHAYWAAILVVLIARGPGAISLDHLLFRRRSA
ncbi:MAG: DoxX family protein [Methylocystis sp.]|uniref:DoxX family protein n=1 Tax=Methylocystis sp. TaxID=1911079 RepID=UPI00395D5354